MTDGYLKLCGPVRIAQQFTIQNNATLYIAGPLSIGAGGTLSLETGSPTPLIVIREPCAGWLTAPGGNNLNDSGIIIGLNATLEIMQVTPIVLNSEINTTMAKPALVPLVDVHGCSEVYGTFKYDADAIPQSNNYFPFSYSGSWTNCTFNVETQDVQFTLPSCPIVWLYRVESQINVGTATHRLCPGAVAGLSVGLGVSAVAGAGAAAALAGASSAAPAAGSEYVAL